MRRDHPEVFKLAPTQPLPAPAARVIEALAPLLTEERQARIEQVVAGRTRAIVPVLDGLIDPHNIAAVLRSADAFGVQEVHLVEGTEPFVASQRVAQGTERWVDVVRHDSAASCVRELRGRGYEVYVASMEGTLSPDTLGSLPRAAVVFGNEHAGVSQSLYELADGTYRIPMTGFVESLNVSVATAITLFTATRGRAGDLSEAERERLTARFMMQSIPRANDVLTERLRRLSK